MRFLKPNNQYRITNNKYGFTLIELMVVVGIIAIALPALFSILFIVIRQQVKVYKLSEVKRQGDYALNIIENTIRNNALSIVDTNGNDVCQTVNTSGTIVKFRDRFNNDFSFTVPSNSNKISSNSSILVGTSVDPLITGGSVYLTSDQVDVNNFAITCVRTEDFSTPLVSIVFDVSQPLAVGITPNPNETATLNYRTKIKLKSY